MKGLNLHLEAPIASFGVGPRLQHRLTQSAPTFSAIVGMIACAMGRKRDEPIDDLKQITMSVISVSHGDPYVDFQSIRDAVTVGGDSGRNAISYRHLLPDYYAIVEIRGDNELIDRIHEAFRRPVWQPYIGRRSNVLSGPIVR